MSSVLKCAIYDQKINFWYKPSYKFLDVRERQCSLFVRMRYFISCLWFSREFRKVLFCFALPSVRSFESVSFQLQRTSWLDCCTTCAPGSQWTCRRLEGMWPWMHTDGRHEEAQEILDVSLENTDQIQGRETEGCIVVMSTPSAWWRRWCQFCGNMYPIVPEYHVLHPKYWLV